MHLDQVLPNDFLDMLKTEPSKEDFKIIEDNPGDFELSLKRWRELGPIDLDSLGSHSDVHMISGMKVEKNGVHYYGQVKDGQRNGIGRWCCVSVIYEGNLENFTANGYGRWIWKDGSYYEGMCRNGQKHGQGKLVHNDGRIEEGTWSDDELKE